MVSSVHHNFILFRYSFYNKHIWQLCNVCGCVLALVVSLLGISYLVVEDGIHQGVCNDLRKNCIGIKLMKHTCTSGSAVAQW